VAPSAVELTFFGGSCLVRTGRTVQGDRNCLGIGLEAALEPRPAVVDRVPDLVVEWGTPLARAAGGQLGGEG